VSDFRKFFDMRKLDAQKLGCVEFVLNSPAYIDTFKPYIESAISSMHRLWLDRSQTRKDEYPDDFLAGGVAFGEGLLKFFEVVIQETKMERIHASMENMTPDLLYAQRQKRGLVKTVVGLDQPALPERGEPDPAEDY